MNVLIKFIGICAFIGVLIFFLNGFAHSAENILQQSYIALEILSATVCTIVFCLCVIIDRLDTLIEKMGNTGHSQGTTGNTGHNTSSFDKIKLFEPLFVVIQRCEARKLGL